MSNSCSERGKEREKERNREGERKKERRSISRSGSCKSAAATGSTKKELQQVVVTETRRNTQFSRK